MKGIDFPLFKGRTGCQIDFRCECNFKQRINFETNHTLRSHGYFREMWIADYEDLQKLVIVFIAAAVVT